MKKKCHVLFDEIEEIDIDLTNICNLKCPLCLSQNLKFSNIFKPHFADIDVIIHKLEQFKNVDNVSLSGDASESTLHPDLIKLLDYLKNRKTIFVELFTNGNTHNEQWWQELNKHFNENSFICFTIAGIQQHTHNFYRVGSDLSKILRHAHAFNTNNSYKNLHMQYIRFQYNKFEKNEDILKVISQFPTYKIINTDPICERFKVLETDKYIKSGICCDKVFQFKYYKKLQQIKNKKTIEICCHNFNKHLIKMDPFGNLFPCVLYRLYSNDKKFECDGYLDYSDIFNNEYEYCYECDKEFIQFLEENHREQIFMC